MSSLCLEVGFNLALYTIAYWRYFAVPATLQVRLLATCNLLRIRAVRQAKATVTSTICMYTVVSLATDLFRVPYSHLPSTLPFPLLVSLFTAPCFFFFVFF